MSLIKCECGKEFLGQEDKEDTCPDCLKKLINSKKTSFKEIEKGCGTYLHKNANCGDKEKLTGVLYLCKNCQELLNDIEEDLE